MLMCVPVVVLVFADVLCIVYAKELKRALATGLLLVRSSNFETTKNNKIFIIKTCIWGTHETDGRGVSDNSVPA